MYHIILGTDEFSPEFLLDTPDISSGYDLLAMVDQVELLCTCGDAKIAAATVSYHGTRSRSSRPMTMTRT